MDPKSLLKKMTRSRESKRRHFQQLFEQKQDLKRQMEEVEEQIQKLQNVLFKLDDKIADLEEQTDGNNVSNAVDGTRPVSGPLIEEIQDDLDLTNDSSEENGLTLNQDEILLDNEDDLIDSSSVEENLTDPLTSTQTAPTFSIFQRNAARLDVSHARSTSSIDITAPHREVPRQENILETLRETFNIEKFRENQQEIIQATMGGNDCFVIMRTGGGKSLLYQLPTVMERPKITLVISPLLSLIQDQQTQVNNFCKGVCVSFHSGVSRAGQEANWRRVRDPDQLVGMILVTPERICKSNRLKSELQHLHAQGRFSRVVIDECHCCCQWGHDFRPDYAKLGILKRMFPNVPTLAVTATASDVVREDCCKILKLSRSHQFFRSSADRPNLTYSIQLKDGTAAQVLDKMADFIKGKHPTDAGIVYTYSRKDAETVAKQLADRGIRARAYHSE